jgi:hypothetical protein
MSCRYRIQKNQDRKAYLLFRLILEDGLPVALLYILPSKPSTGKLPFPSSINGRYLALHGHNVQTVVGKLYEIRVLILSTMRELLAVHLQ